MPTPGRPNPPVTFNIDDCHMVAKMYGGEFLSDKLDIYERKYPWKCSNGHIWEALPYTVVKQNTWCPICAKTSSYSERICRAYFEHLFQAEFPKLRPEWLRNPKTGRKLELDGYCEKLKLAFEHQGTFHFNVVWHNTVSKLENNNQRDADKRKISKAFGITLIEIPALFEIIKLENLQDYIVNECQKFGIIINNSRLTIPVDLSKVRVNDIIDRLRKIAKDRNGKLISEVYLGMGSKLTWECHLGHQWEATPSHIKYSGSWCPKCPKPKPFLSFTLEDMHNLAKKFGGLCLSTEYKNRNLPIKWECSKGHQWDTRPSTALKTWCPICYYASKDSKKICLLELKAIAKDKGGSCLSDAYKNCEDKLLWRCKFGHEWWESGYNIKKMGNWCRICKRNLRLVKKLRCFKCGWMHESNLSRGFKCSLCGFTEKVSINIKLNYFICNIDGVDFQSIAKGFFFSPEEYS
jgi:hypothetical protein